MLELYGNTISPYLADGAYWASMLYKGWTSHEALNGLLRTPINNSV